MSCTAERQVHSTSCFKLIVYFGCSWRNLNGARLLLQQRGNRPQPPALAAVQAMSPRVQALSRRWPSPLQHRQHRQRHQLLYRSHLLSDRLSRLRRWLTQRRSVNHHPGGGRPPAMRQRNLRTTMHQHPGCTVLLYLNRSRLQSRQQQPHMRR